MEEKIKVLWAVPCTYYGSEALSDLYEFFEGEKKFKEKLEEVEFVGAYDGAEASKKIHENGDFDLVVLDQDLPYVEITERFLLGISCKKFFVIRILKTGGFQVEKTEKKSLFQLKGNLEGPFEDIGKILEKIF